jgi:hypothetical protein
MSIPKDARDVVRACLLSTAALFAAAAVDASPEPPAPAE